MRVFYLSILFLESMSFLYASAGSITGEVIDSDTHQPLIGANVIIAGTELGARL